MFDLLAHEGLGRFVRYARNAENSEKPERVIIQSF